MAKSYYAAKISPHRGRTEEGYLVCAAVPVARTGYQFYLRNELDFEPSESVKSRDGGYDVYRPEEEVFSDVTLASLEGKPVTDDHPGEALDSSNWNLYTKGVVKNARRGEAEYNDFILADLMIWDKSLVEKIESGKQGVSVGYTCDYDESDGELRQKDIVCNHVAVVDEGRAGEKAVIRDSSTTITINNKEDSMAEEIKVEATVGAGEERPEEIIAVDECKKDEAKTDECKTEDSVDLAEVIKDLVGRVEALEAKLAKSEKTGFDALEEEIFKERKVEENPEARDEEKKEELVGDSAIVKFIGQVKPLVATIKDEAKRKAMTDSMCRIIRTARANDKKEVKRTVYSSFVQQDAGKVEENPYAKFFRK